MSHEPGNSKCRDSLVIRAEELLPIIRRQSRRAFVLELTGTPKAGKTSIASALKAFLRDHKYRVHLMRERAGECPLPMKGHVFFNAWTTCSMLSELLENAESNSDVIILDRGLFDALVWVEKQRRQQMLTKEEKRAFDGFVLLKRWRSLIDAVAIMKTKAAIAASRENIGLLVDRTSGSIMNKAALASYNSCLRRCQKKYENEFNIMEFNTTECDQRTAGRDVASWFLDEMQKWVDPEIAVLEKEDAVHLLGPQQAVFGRGSVTALINSIAGKIRWKKRSQVPPGDAFVQVVAAGILRDISGKYLVFRRSNDDPKAAKYGFETLWRGWHVARGEQQSLNEIMIHGLYKRWLEDLHLADNYNPKDFFEPHGLAWINDGSENARHLGVIYRVSSKTDDFSQFIQKKEFRRAGRGHMLVGRFMELEELRAKRAELEPWSQRVVDFTQADA